ncbi:HNH endonuclease [Virgibacillus doumboii]|uniref:HNH endonuclease n=1 Tax=Virgibacillus doumboii TaxID=2697503 RepID=UPI0013E04B45|nr:HNH endonuclease [Virgibacillus doumboii]
MSTGRQIPLPLKRELRQEGVFGCVLCGSPIIEYHHIIPFHQIKSHNREEMVILCPEHHHRADCGEIPKDILYNAKNQPFNRNVEHISKDFFLRDYNSLKLKVGSNIYIRTPILLEVDGHPLITIGMEENKALLNAKFYNRQNKLLAEIVDNEWFAYKNEELWDMQYSPGRLKINRGMGNISLEFTINEDLVELRGNMYYNGYKIELHPSKTILGDSNIMSNCTIADCGKGIVITSTH